LQTSALVAGTSLFVQRSIGAARARALALLAEPLAAETAAQWGLIWKCVDDADLLDEALAVAQKLADGPPVALGLIKKQLEFAGLPTLLRRSIAKPRRRPARS
jgi:2-(1,2-epoxy-1,2-dihydrophenyl)acetyl-CoA isomerase